MAWAGRALPFITNVSKHMLRLIPAEVSSERFKQPAQLYLVLFRMHAATLRHFLYAGVLWCLGTDIFNVLLFSSYCMYHLVLTLRMFEYECVLCDSDGKLLLFH